MLRKMYLLLCLLLAGNAAAQQLNFVWAKGMGAPNAMGNAGATGINMCHDVLGNVYLAGTFQDTVDFDPGPGTFFMSSTTMYDVFILKLDQSGNFQWAKRLTGGDNEGPTSIAMDNAGNLLLFGEFKASMDFDPDSAASFVLTSYGASDAYLVKLSASGAFIWARQFGGSDADRGNTMVIDDTGHILIGGLFKGTADFDPSAATSLLNSNGGNDAYLAKISPTGNLVWVKSYGGPYWDEIHSICVSPSGHIYAAGSFIDNVDFDPGAGIFSISTPNTTTATVIWHISSSGNFTWARPVLASSPNGHITPTGIHYHNTGVLFVSGYFDQSADFNPDVNADSVLSSVAGSQDLFLLKLDDAGLFRWVRSIGNNNIDASSCVISDAAGHCYFKGSFGGTLDIDPHPVNSSTISSGGGPGSRSEYLAVLDPSGNFTWGAKTEGFSVGYRGNIIDLDQHRFYHAGQFGGTVDFDPASSVFNLSSAPATGTAFLVQLNRSSTGLDGPSAAASFCSLVPNPASDLFQVRSSRSLNKASIHLLDASGKVVLRETNLNGTVFNLDVQGLSPGTYLVEIMDASGREAHKLLIER
ncbi:MAG: T9SS type A sorting domain-containing protein [Bacteroidia bacterium]|nr:T9SS type A sorting domain-containing protein [Bacteroidia bacterium]